MDGEERRRHVRMLCAGLIEIRWADDHGRLRETMANFDDLSEGGACLSLDDAIAPGAPVIVGPSTHALTAEVCYCRPFDGGWLIGVKFTAPVESDAFAYAPARLLNPAEALIDAQPLLTPDFHRTVACMTLSDALSNSEN